MWLLLFLPALASASPTMESGRATTYWPGDGMSGGVRADGKLFHRRDRHIAHRTIRLGTSGLLCSLRTGRCTSTAVRDRGPYGAVRPCSETRYGKQIRWMGECHRWCAPLKLPRGWTWRGAFDITKPIARALRHRSFDQLVFLYWR